MTLCTVALIAFAAGLAVAALPAHAHAPTPPASRRTDVRETLHGVEVADPYRWLEDQTSAETRAWIEAQNKHTQSVIGALPIRKAVAGRLTQLRRIDSMGAPTVRAGRYFFSRKRADDEQYIQYWRQGLRGKDRVLFDPHPLSADKTSSCDLFDVTDDGKRVAIAVRKGGEDEVEVRVLDVDTGAEVGRLPKGHIESFDFVNDGLACYYTRLEPLVGRRVYRRDVAGAAASEIEVFGREYPAETMVGASVSENGRWLLLAVYRGWSQNDIFVKDLRADGPIRPVVRGVDAVFSPDFADDRMIVLTDYKAPNRRIVEADLTGTPPDRWREIVPAGDEAIEGFSLCGGKLFTASLHDVSTRIRVFDLEGKTHGNLKLPGIGSSSTPSGRWSSKEAFFSFTSYTAPTTTFRYDVETGGRSQWSKSKVPVRTSDFTTRQVWVTSRDGTRVPMFLVHRKGLKMDGARPTHLTGYGGFAASMTPWFDPEAVVLAEHGGVLAVPALRGGGEFGEAWHRAGMLGNKQNVFDDFHACAEWLVKQGITNADHLAISGGSNGGLLVGAALTQRPELFRAVVCEVPLLDMVRYHQFLQGPQWVPEYGSSADPEQCKWLLAYSPYHHVKPNTKYPSVLFVTGDADTRVAPLHARKMTAMLQSVASPDRPILLHYDTSLGHSGGEPLSKQIENRSLVLGFLLGEIGGR